jgi:hypothetical protein
MILEISWNFPKYPEYFLYLADQAFEGPCLCNGICSLVALSTIITKENNLITVNLNALSSKVNKHGKRLPGIINNGVCTYYMIYGSKSKDCINLMFIHLGYFERVTKKCLPKMGIVHCFRN